MNSFLKYCGDTIEARCKWMDYYEVYCAKHNKRFSYNEMLDVYFDYMFL